MQPALLPDLPPRPERPLPLALRECPEYRVATDSRAANIVEVLTVLVGERTARNLLEACKGNLQTALTANAIELAQTVPGLGAKRAVKVAARLKAAVEFGRRVSAPLEAPTIWSPADAAGLLRPCFDGREQEYLYVLLLNTRGRVIGQPVEVYHGSLNTSLIRVAEVFRDAIKVNAASIIIAHNHPSGDPNPSPEDVAVTRSIKEAGQLFDITLNDHLVFGAGEKFVSLKERALGF